MFTQTTMKTQDALNILGISTQVTQDEIRNAYRKACKQYHPDINPAGLEMMKLVNLAFEALQDFTPLEDDSGQESDYGNRLNQALNAILDFGLGIEVCGAWIWVTGDTFKYKDTLKVRGFKYAPKKQAWYFRPEKYKSSSRGSWTLDEIKERYGAHTVKRKHKQLSA